MASFRFIGTRTRVLTATLALAVLLGANLGVASANSIPHPDIRINLFVPPPTAPANTAFWIGHGFGMDSGELPSDVAPGSEQFQLYVDGTAVGLHKDLEFKGGASAGSVSALWYHTFTDGLPAGEHSFVGRWYQDGSLTGELVAVVLFE
jgi:hypothetical protein